MVGVSNRGILCVIPARAGSKGIPGKNTVDFDGKPLLAWTIEAALSAASVGPVIVSSESERIANIAREMGAEVPFLRPGALAEDDVHAVHTALHALDWYKKAKGYLPLGTMMLLPTSPLRTAEHVEAAARMFIDRKASAVIGVTDLGKHMTNLRFMRDCRLERIATDVSPNQQRQGERTLFGVTGAMFLAKSTELIAHKTFHVPGALGFSMSALSAVDVNTPEDLSFARWIKRSGWSDQYKSGQ